MCLMSYITPIRMSLVIITSVFSKMPVFWFETQMLNILYVEKACIYVVSV